MTTPVKPATPTTPRVFHCSFCAKSQHEVALLINGPGVFICDECVALCEQIFETEAPAAGTRDLHSVESLDSERLLHMLGTSQQAAERIDEAMQDIVDVLRERGVSWATIGESLAVSRQAAWKRFG